MPTPNAAYTCECLDGGHDTGNGVCMCGGAIKGRSAATVQELLVQAELALHRERTGPDSLYDPDLEAYLKGKRDGLQAALEAMPRES